MASKRPYYTSTDLIEAVKRKMAFPIAQVTFSETDILDFANEEMFNAQVPSIMQFHEEYFVHVVELPLKSRVSKYPIPNRAIGMKMRDVFYQDENHNKYEMTKINPDDQGYFQANLDNYQAPFHYYLQNNSMIITPEIGNNPVGVLRTTIFLRPNSLVTNDRAAISQSFSKIITVDNTTMVAGDTLTIGSTVIVADTDFLIGVNSAETASNLSIYLNTISVDITSTSDSNLVVVDYQDSSTGFTSSSTGMVVQSSITIKFDQVPNNITNGSLIDFLQTDGGHSTLKYDVKLTPNSVSPTSITFEAGVIPDDFVVGDYICTAYECIVPQIPSDLHGLLAERTVARILESLGDKDGLKAANEKIDKLELSQGTLIDSRVDGSPMKVFNRHSLLRWNKTRGIRGRF